MFVIATSAHLEVCQRCNNGHATIVLADGSKQMVFMSKQTAHIVNEVLLEDRKITREEFDIIREQIDASKLIESSNPDEFQLLIGQTTLHQTLKKTGSHLN